jgi:hypothetical protein
VKARNEIRQRTRNGQGLGDPVGEKFTRASRPNSDQLPTPPVHSRDGTCPVVGFVDADRDRAVSGSFGTHISSLTNDIVFWTFTADPMSCGPVHEQIVR